MDAKAKGRAEALIEAMPYLRQARRKMSEHKYDTGVLEEVVREIPGLMKRKVAGAGRDELITFWVEALPYLHAFRDRVIVVKFGGHAMTAADLIADFERDVAALESAGIHPIVVHGGGPMINARLAEADVKSEFVDGVRVTDDATMAVAQEVLSEVNQTICKGIEAHGGRAVGLVDGECLKVERMPSGAPGVSLGRVGLVREVSPELRNLATQADAIPVVAPLGVDKDGVICNVNADYAAQGVAAILGADKLVLMTNTEGVLDADERLISRIDGAHTEELIESGVIGGGMLPKVRCALDAVKGGVKNAHIIDGRVEHALLLELLTDEGVGTLVTGS